MNWHDALSKIVLPAAFLDRFLLSYLAIATALIVKFFFVHQLTRFTWRKCLLADVTINVVSALLGLILLPLAGFFWLFPTILIRDYLNIGGFDIGAVVAPFTTWVAALSFAVFINAWLETVTLRLVFNQGEFEASKKFFWWLCVANVPVVFLAFGQLLAFLVWQTTHNRYLLFDFIGHYLDAVILFAIGMTGLLYYPHKIAKEIKSGKRSEPNGEALLKKAKWCCYLMFLFGLLKVVEFF